MLLLRACNYYSCPATKQNLPKVHLSWLIGYICNAQIASLFYRKWTEERLESITNIFSLDLFVQLKNEYLAHKGSGYALRGSLLLFFLSALHKVQIIGEKGKHLA